MVAVRLIKPRVDRILSCINALLLPLKKKKFCHATGVGPIERFPSSHHAPHGQ